MSGYGERMAAQRAATHYRKHNEWQSSPDALDSGLHDLPAQPCPNCKHPLAAHNDDGCGAGWDFGSQDGCECVLTLANQFRATR